MEVMRLEKRIDVTHFLIRHLGKFHTHLSAHTLNMAKFLHALARMGETNGTGDVVIHRIVNKRTKFAIQAC